MDRLADVDADADQFADSAFGHTDADWHSDFHRDPNAYTAQSDPDGNSHADSDARPAVSDTYANVDANARAAVPNSFAHTDADARAAVPDSYADADRGPHKDFHSDASDSRAGRYLDTNAGPSVCPPVPDADGIVCLNPATDPGAGPAFRASSGANSGDCVRRTSVFETSRPAAALDSRRQSRVSAGRPQGSDPRPRRDPGSRLGNGSAA